MIQPYFKPDYNPSVPAFVTFYNGYFQERSKMNMQMMDLMLRQASPEYLKNIIDRTENNIKELQKTKSKIIQSAQKDRMDLIKVQTNLDFQALKIQGTVNRENQEMLQRALLGKTGGGISASTQNRATKEEGDIKNKKAQLKSQMLGQKGKKNAVTFLNDSNLDKNFQLSDVALALEVLQENKAASKDKATSQYFQAIELQLKQKLSGNNPDDILKNKYPFARGQGAVPQKTSEDRAEELGFMLTVSESSLADQFIIKNPRTGKLEIDIPTPMIQSVTGGDPNEEKKLRENIEKRYKQRILQEKKGYVGAPKVEIPSQSDLEATIKLIDDQLKEESQKLEGYLTRYDIGQQNLLESIFDPFESNYRTENLFVRKTPEVLRQEKEIREMQYRERDDTPLGYQNIKYNTEYQAPGGLNFGITKVGDEQIPYIFEGDKPYEIKKTDPSYSFILELLSEQDRKLGAI